MKKSEKILLGVLGVVSLYAGYILVFEGEPQGDKGPGVQAVDESGYTSVVAGLEAQMAAKQLSPAERYRVDLALAGVDNVPFYASAGQFYFTAGDDAVVVSETGGLVYSGYLQVNGRTFAIVNGVEYEAGEELSVEGYRLERVSKDFIVVERTDPNSGKVFKKQIPLAGSDMEQISLRTAP